MNATDQKNAREISIKVIFTILLFALSMGVFVLLALAVVDQKDLFDSHAFAFFGRYTNDRVIAVMKTITFFGSNSFLLPAYILIVGFLLYLRKKRWAIDIGILALTSTGLMHLLKFVFRRPRPDVPIFDTLKTYSFPSGHALSSFVFASALIYLLWNENKVPRWAKWVFSILLFFFSITVGLSRVVLRYHYASDVIGGFSLGFAWTVLSLWMHEKVHDRVGKRRET